MTDLDTLRERWLSLTRQALPARAAAESGWPVRFDHCFMRIALDHAVGGRWTDRVERPAYRNLSAGQLGRAVSAAERMLAEGQEAARALNAQSLRWRRDARRAEGAR